MTEITRPQMLALAELADGSCWPAAQTGHGWINGGVAARLVDMGYAERMWWGGVAGRSEHRTIGGMSYIYRISDAGRRVLTDPVAASPGFLAAALSMVRGGRHARGSMRLGDSAQVWCSCGWGRGNDVFDDPVEISGDSGADTSRILVEAFVAHIDACVAAEVVRTG